MPINHCIVHLVDKKPTEATARLHPRMEELPIDESLENLLLDLIQHYNAKPSKVWGHFNPDSENSWSFQQALEEFLAEKSGFVAFTTQATEFFKLQLDSVEMSSGGHLIFFNYQQGMTDYLLLALLPHSETYAISERLALDSVSHLDLAQIQLAARINLSEWKNNPQSKQYLSLIKGRSSKTVADFFLTFLDAIEGVSAPNETRTLLKAFSDYVESEDLADEQTKQKTDALVAYTNEQVRRGQPVALHDLSEVLDEENPQAFYDYIRHKDYGLAPEIPADKRTINQFRRFTGRAEGLSISFESHLLGSKIDYDAEQDVLIIRQLPTQLKNQLILK